jgi:hypothetical protein
MVDRAFRFVVFSRTMDRVIVPACYQFCCHCILVTCVDTCDDIDAWFRGELLGAKVSSGTFTAPDI